MTTRRHRHRQHANPFNIRQSVPALISHQIYGREAPMALDVGFGSGMFLLELARRNPQWNILGLEIRQHLIDDVLGSASQQNLRNLHAILANANLHLETLIADASLIFVSVNFPDPWFKKRHQKRRVINRTWLDLLARKMLPKASLHIMSDFEPLALDAKAVLAEHPAFHSPQGGDFLPESSTGILTEREITHQKRGCPIYRLHYLRKEIGPG
ncbi:MAG: tRNA (guanosine(46)-N7)-methyltransferase TrmB [Myxococcota bacterium]